MKDVFGELCNCMKEKLSALSFLRANDLKELCGFFKCKNVAKGETLWNEGDICDYVAFIVSGRVEVKKETDFKEKQVIVGIYSNGAIVGELCILDGSPRAVTAVALEDVSLVLITRENFNKLIDEYPELGAQLMKGMLLSVSIRLRSSFARLAAIF